MREEPKPAGSVAVMPARRSTGRPTREAAVERDARLLAVATRMFEARGFDATTMEAVAEAAGVGKPTIYVRFRDKADLFKAVFHARVTMFLTPLAAAVQAVIEAEMQDGPHADGARADVDTVLVKIGMTMLPRVLTPESIAINRIVVAEAFRFPDLAQLAQREGWQASVSILATLLELYAADGRIVVQDPHEAADLFLSLLMGRLQRETMLGLKELDAAAVQKRVLTVVRIFLHGVGARSG